MILSIYLLDIILVAPLKLRILVVLSPIKTTSPINPSISTVSPISYSPSVIMENPAIKSFARSWKASPIIAVPIPNPAKIDPTLNPKRDAIANNTRITIIYLIIFNRTAESVCTLCF